MIPPNLRGVHCVDGKLYRFGPISARQPLCPAAAGSSYVGSGGGQVMAEAKVRMVCETCGSEDVMHDAWAVWDTGTQEWVLGAVFDYMHCDNCQGETDIEELPMKV
jgi:hypothetical protein